MKLLAGAFVLATAADAVTFASLPAGAELNPLIAPLALPIAWAVKLALVGLVAGVAAALLERRRYLPAVEAMFLVGILVGAFGAGANVTAAATPRPAQLTTRQEAIERPTVVDRDPLVPPPGTSAEPTEAPPARALGGASPGLVVGPGMQCTVDDDGSVTCIRIPPAEGTPRSSG